MLCSLFSYPILSKPFSRWIRKSQNPSLVASSNFSTKMAFRYHSRSMESNCQEMIENKSLKCKYISLWHSKAAFLEFITNTALNLNFDKPDYKTCCLFFSRLPNCVIQPPRDTCLIVKDLKKGLREDHEDSVNHFKVHSFDLTPLLYVCSC